MRFLVSLAVFLLSVYGLANAIAVLKIGRYFIGVGHCTDANCSAPGHPLEKRKGLGRIPYVGDLLYCPPCLAFWIGMAFSVYIFSPSSEFTGIRWKSAVVDGLAASGTSWLIHAWAMRTINGIADI